MEKRSKADKVIYGLIMGLFFPVIIFLIQYKLKYNDIKFISYVESLMYFRILLKVFTLCVLPNIVLFYIFLNTKKMYIARGIVMACFFYAFIVLGFRIFG